MLDFFQQSRKRECRSVELRALCNEVPRNPPGPEGSNGTGEAECAAGTPKFLVEESAQKTVGSLPEILPHQVIATHERLRSVARSARPGRL